jgi:hypothetical protein
MAQVERHVIDITGQEDHGLADGMSQTNLIEYVCVAPRQVSNDTHCLVDVPPYFSGNAPAPGYGIRTQTPEMTMLNYEILDRLVQSVELGREGHRHEYEQRINTKLAGWKNRMTQGNYLLNLSRSNCSPSAILRRPVAVGTPERPPHRSRRAVFPHRALR